jgi:hypothetical protein
LRRVFGPVPLGGAKGYRRFASRTVLPLGSIDHEYQLSLIDFGQTLLFSPREGLAKAKSARYPPAGHPFGHAVPSEPGRMSVSRSDGLAESSANVRELEAASRKRHYDGIDRDGVASLYVYFAHGHIAFGA